jgi:hypothetical protein
MYREHHARSRTGVKVLGVILALALLVWAAYLIGASTSTSRTPSAAPDLEAPSAAAVPSPTAVPVPILARADPSSDPVASAEVWLSAYQSLRYDDPTPMAWIDRVRPVVTGRLNAEYAGYREGTVGASWEELVRQKCIAAVENAGGVIPREALSTRTTVYVQIAGTLHIRCQDPTAAQRPAEDLAATLELTRGRDGLWRVDRRLY